ncbi:hypothetical protein QE152_g13543 [Popillia japonica]|uniref:Uncharacterized protein n=1 Tax=Popillia japonica TaxID=7064 RepID=A0AAW1LCL1_POPJA
MDRARCLLSEANIEVIISRNVKFIEKDTKYIRLEDDDIEEDEEKQETIQETETNKDNAEIKEVINMKRSKRETKFPKRFEDYEVNVNYADVVVPTSYEDNSGAITLAKNGKFSKNSKHIDVSYHFVHDYERKKLIDVQKIHTNDQVADILTKSLGKIKFQKFRILLGLRSDAFLC